MGTWHGGTSAPSSTRLHLQCCTCIFFFIGQVLFYSNECECEVWCCTPTYVPLHRHSLLPVNVRSCVQLPRSTAGQQLLHVGGGSILARESTDGESWPWEMALSPTTRTDQLRRRRSPRNRHCFERLTSYPMVGRVCLELKAPK